MTEIIVGLLASVGLISVALISNRGRQHSKAAREQVENSHTTNMREEGDERHHLLVNLITGVQSDVRGIRRDNGRMQDRFEKHLEETAAALARISALEDTMPGRPPLTSKEK